MSRRSGVTRSLPTNPRVIFVSPAAAGEADLVPHLACGGGLNDRDRLYIWKIDFVMSTHRRSRERSPLIV